MRRGLTAGLLLLLTFPLFAEQTRPRRRGAADEAESAIERAIEALGEEKKGYERDLEILRRLQAAEEALVDPMQPAATVQKALDEVALAERLVTDFALRQGIIRIRLELEAARRSPVSTDFGRLRSKVRDEGLHPASRIVARNALRLEEETLAWLEVQQMIGEHLRMMSEMAGKSMRATQQ